MTVFNVFFIEFVSTRSESILNIPSPFRMRNIVSQEGEVFYLEALILLRSYLLIPEPYMAQEKGLSISIRRITYDHFSFMKEV